MARPHKAGLDYFPKDTDVFNDRKIRKLLTEFGACGYVVYDYIVCLCYKEGGYYVSYDDDFCFDVADAVRCGTTKNSVSEILKGCFRLSLFNQGVYDVSNIITSSGIQKRYLKIKRTGVIDKKHRVIAEETIVNAEETLVNDATSTQSKVKESKVNINDDNDSAGVEDNIPAYLQGPKFEPLQEIAEIAAEYLTLPKYTASREQMCIANHLTTDQLKHKVTEFNAMLTKNAEYSFQAKDWIRYLGNWIPKRIKYENDGNTTGNTAKSAKAAYQTTGTKGGASISDLQGLKRNRENNNIEPDEFTPIELVD